MHTIELRLRKSVFSLTFNPDYTYYTGIDTYTNSPIYGHHEGESAPPGYPPNTKKLKASQTTVATAQDQQGRQEKLSFAESVAKAEQAKNASNSSSATDTSTPEVHSTPAPDQEGDQGTLSKFRRGPKINGFQLGMTLEEFKANLDGIVPDLEAHESVDWQETQEIGDAVYDPLLRADKHLHTVDFMPQQGAAMAEVKVVGSPAIVLSITFTDQLMTKMFNLGGMTFEDFCQNMIDHYDIPRLKSGADNIYSYNDPIHPQLALSTPKMYYISSDGWTIVFKDSFWTDLSITPPAPAIDHGFGK